MSIKITPVKIWRRKESLSNLIGKRGMVESVTIVRAAPSGFGQYAPYPVAIVKLSNGRRIMGQMTDYHADEVTLGQKVVAVLRRLRTEEKKDVISYVIKFRPL